MTPKQKYIDYGSAPVRNNWNQSLEYKVQLLL